MAGTSSRKKHILAINDDQAILDLFNDLLTDEGFQVTLDVFSRSTSEILSHIRSVEPDLVIMDFIIGNEGGGWQLLQAVRMDRRTRHIPIIVCTGAARQIQELSAHLSAMRVQIVLKPFDIDHLIEMVHAALPAAGENDPP
jgi:CheY-like chemotaxis protein